MTDYIRKFIERLSDKREEKRKMLIENEVNSRITVHNDINDNDNEIYIFVDDVPILRVSSDKFDETAISLGDVSIYLSMVKDMYRRSLNKKMIRE